jgi:hypothetical protein
MSNWIRRGSGPGLALLAMVAAGCGNLAQQGRGPSQAIVSVIEAASGAEPAKFGGTLGSDVVTYVKRTVNGSEVRVPTIFSDSARATVTVEMKDPALATGATSINQVTFNRYHVEFERADGRNKPGVDVPYAFDSAVTFTVAPGSTSSAGFELVRHVAKLEAPLVQLVDNFELITTIATITFYGKDHAGNDVSASGKIGVTFGNFGDPE